MYFNKVEGNPVLRTKVETFFPGNPHDLTVLFTKLISIFNETDLFPKWFPRGVMKSSNMMQQVSKFSKTVKIQVAMAYPLSMLIGPRETNVIGQGFDMSERSSVCIVVRTLKEGEVINGMKTPGTTKGYTPFNYESAYYFELKPTGIVFKLIQLMDLNLSYVPPSILNYISKGVIPFEMIANLKRQIRNFEGSEWEERVNSNPELYNEVDKRLLNYMETKLGIVPQPLQTTPKTEEADDANSQSGRMSVSSANRRRKGKGLNGMARRLSQRMSSKRTVSGRKLSRAGKRSIANLNKVELYDYSLKTDSELKQERESAKKRRAAALPDYEPKGVQQVLLYYLILFLVSAFSLFDKKSLLVEYIPALKDEYPKVFADVE